MRPKINVLENDIPVTREMTEEEYAEYLEMVSNAAGDTEDTGIESLQARIAALETAAVNNT